MWCRENQDDGEDGGVLAGDDGGVGDESGSGKCGMVVVKLEWWWW